MTSPFSRARTARLLPPPHCPPPSATGSTLSTSDTSSVSEESERPLSIVSNRCCSPRGGNQSNGISVPSGKLPAPPERCFPSSVLPRDAARDFAQSRPGPISPLQPASFFSPPPPLGAPQVADKILKINQDIKTRVFLEYQESRCFEITPALSQNILTGTYRTPTFSPAAGDLPPQTVKEFEKICLYMIVLVRFTIMYCYISSCAVYLLKNCKINGGICGICSIHQRSLYRSMGPRDKGVFFSNVQIKDYVGSETKI